ncbi:MAG: type I restriction endonuclease subunit R [Anaerolineae bacterium]|nr:type I restriction endonuclease subunit R [Anaerolineae bacterium]
MPPSYREELISQIPALQLLMAMGWQYLTPAEALERRGGKKGAVVLTGVLEPWLAEHNSITHKGQHYAFSEANIREALRRLVDQPYDGLLPANERVYELLTLGISLPQTISGDSRSYSLRYIDWADPRNNVYQVADEFIVERSRSHLTRRPDIVLFVNGIPLAVVECKRPDLDKGGQKAVDEAISQMLASSSSTMSSCTSCAT